MGSPPAPDRDMVMTRPPAGSRTAVPEASSLLSHPMIPVSASVGVP